MRFCVDQHFDDPSAHLLAQLNKSSFDLPIKNILSWLEAMRDPRAASAGWKKWLPAFPQLQQP